MPPPLQAQILLLLASSSGKVRFNDLLKWTEYKDKGYFTRLIRRLHMVRILEFHEPPINQIELLPPGVERATELASYLSEAKSRA